MPFGLGSSGSKKLKGAAVNGADGITRNAPSQGSTGLTLKNNLTVLIVDDNKVNRRIHKMLLTNLGVKSQEVENGQEAVDLHLSGAFFDLILMDNEMPVMTGPRATQMLRMMGVRCKIVGVSGNSRDSEIKDFMAAGLDEYCIKPMTLSKLISILQEVDYAKAQA